MNTGIDKLLLEQGRRVVLVFTDGVDMPMNFSNHNKSLKDVMKRAEEDNVDGLRDRPRGPERHAGLRAGAAATAAAAGWARAAFGGLGGRGLGGYGGGQPQMEKPDEGLPKIAAATGGGYFELTSTARSGGRPSRASPTSSIISTRSASRRRSSTARCTI